MEIFTLVYFAIGIIFSSYCLDSVDSTEKAQVSFLVVWLISCILGFLWPAFVCMEIYFRIKNQGVK